MKIEWHPKAVDDLLAIGSADQRRIKQTLGQLAKLDDARPRLVPYSGNLKGFWKLLCGDYRLVCQLTQRDGMAILVIYLAHRSRAYEKRGQRIVKSRSET